MSHLLKELLLKPGSRLGRVSQVLHTTEVPWLARWELLYLGIGKRLLRSREYCVHLGGGQLYFGANSLIADQRAFDEIFIEKCYPADYRRAVVVDVGAHKGYFGAYALLNGAAVVLSYEPEQSNYSYLEACAASFRLRGLTWQTFRCAVGARTGQGELYLSNESWCHTLVPMPGLEPVSVQTVGLTAMSAVLQEAGCLQADRLVVKVDAEGSECDVVLGTPATEWRAVDEMFVEVHACAPCSAVEIVERLHTAGLAVEANLPGDILHLRRNRE